MSQPLIRQGSHHKHIQRRLANIAILPLVGGHRQDLVLVAGQPWVQRTQDLLRFRAVPALHPDQRKLQQLIHLQHTMSVEVCGSIAKVLPERAP